MNHRTRPLPFLALVTLFLSLSLAACGVFAKKEKKSAGSWNRKPKVVAVLPVTNRTQDLSAPVLIRYFLEKYAAKGGLKLGPGMEEVDVKLRQMGIMGGNQIESRSLQQIGQLLRVEGVLQTTLLDYHQDASVQETLIRAEFKLVSTQSGQVFWSRDVSLREKGLKKIPIAGAITGLPPQMIRSVARSPSAFMPKKLVREALKTLD